jgi:hypothetical protein
MGDWKKFKKISPRAAAMTASIYKGGRLSLTKAVFDSIGSQYIELYFNSERNAIGIKVCDESSEDALELRNPARQTSWLVSIKAFLSYYKIPPVAEAKRYAVEEEDGLFVIDLNKPMT